MIQRELREAGLEILEFDMTTIPVSPTRVVWRYRGFKEGIGFTISIIQYNNVIELETIAVEKAGEGVGSLIMNVLMKYVIEVDKTLILHPVHSTKQFFIKMGMSNKRNTFSYNDK